MMNAEEKREIRSNHNRFLKERGRSRDIQYDRVLNAYRRMVMDGEESDAVPVLANRFDITERVVRGIIDRRGKNRNPKLDVMLEGKMVLHFEGLDNIINMAVEEMQDQFLKLEEMEDKGEKFSDVELVEITEKGKIQRTQRKRVPIQKAKLDLLNEMTNARIKFFTAVNKLIGSTNINLLQDNRRFVGSFAELQDQLRSVRSMEKLRGVDTVIEGEADV